MQYVTKFTQNQTVALRSSRDKTLRVVHVVKFGADRPSAAQNRLLVLPLPIASHYFAAMLCQDRKTPTSSVKETGAVWATAPAAPW
jgi:hypothetical protein